MKLISQKYMKHIYVVSCALLQIVLSYKRVSQQRDHKKIRLIIAMGIWVMFKYCNRLIIIPISNISLNEENEKRF